MRILAIETSCDETAAAVVEDGTRVLSSIIATSRDSFTRTGGVIPEQAARLQIRCILPVIHDALHDAGMHKTEIDAIAVTYGPGLFGSLLVGTITARALSTLWNTPLIGVHHTLGHLSSPWLDVKKEDPSLQFPLLTLSASGGHTDLWLRTGHTTGTLLGRTRDDAAGEAFDKAAKLLGLSYPGGPAIAAAAQAGDASIYSLPLPLAQDASLDFSFSGLKTALRNAAMQADIPTDTPHLAAAFQYAACRHLADRVCKALARYPTVSAVHVVGGVSANLVLREMLQSSCSPIAVRWPTQMGYCTDNAAMIGAAAYFMVQERGMAEASVSQPAVASLPLESALQTS